MLTHKSDVLLAIFQVFPGLIKDLGEHHYNKQCYPFEFLDTVDRTPVKLHAAADAICSGAKNHRVPTNELDIVRQTAVVRQV